MLLASTQPFSYFTYESDFLRARLCTDCSNGMFAPFSTAMRSTSRYAAIRFA